MNFFDPVGVDDMAAGLCGIPRITLHPILCLDPSLILLPQVLLTADTGWAPIPTGCTGGLTRLTITLATITTQVDHMLESRHVCKVGKCRTHEINVIMTIDNDMTQMS